MLRLETIDDVDRLKEILKSFIELGGTDERYIMYKKVDALKLIDRMELVLHSTDKTFGILLPYYHGYGCRIYFVQCIQHIENAVNNLDADALQQSLNWLRDVFQRATQGALRMIDIGFADMEAAERAGFKNDVKGYYEEMAFKSAH